MLPRLLLLLTFALWTVEAITFDISPNTFVAGVTPTVLMRCDVADSGSEMLQLLLIQIEINDRGQLLPMVTLTPGTSPTIMESGQDKPLQVDGTINQFANIGQSFLSVRYSFPGTDTAGNYTCIVSGLSTTGMLSRYTETASLTIGATDEIPQFMTSEVVELRAIIEDLKKQRQQLLDQADSLKAEEQNITQELVTVESEFNDLASKMQSLKARSDQLDDIILNATTELNALRNVRPAQKVAFHAGMSALGARPVSLHMHVPLVFDHVITNEGQGYDPTTGIFRAPVSGTYLITVSMLAGAGGRFCELAIMVNEQYVQTMQMADDTEYEHSTVTTIVHLQGGDSVRCEFTWHENNPGYLGTTLTSAPYVSTFSGYVIW